MSFEVLWGHPNADTPIDVHDVPVTIPDLPAALEGFALAMVTDVHYGQFVDAAYARRIVDVVNDRAADAIVVLGDLMDRDRRQIAPCARIMSALRAPRGVFGCPGNHEYLVGGPEAIAALAAAGIKLLINAHTRISTGGDDLIIAGLDDWDCGDPDPAAALEGTSGDDPVIILSHNPDQAEHLGNVGRVDLMLSGHTHGGQITLWGWPIVTQTRHRKYARGLATGPRCQVYTSRGVGVTRLPIRVCCRPEIPVIRLTRGVNACHAAPAAVS